MTEYEEITNGKDIAALRRELEHQYSLGFTSTDHFPQYIQDLINKRLYDREPRNIEFVCIDEWSRPIYKYVDRNIYLGSVDILFPNKEIAPNNTVEEINKYFQEHPEEFVYFGTSIDDDPYGGKFKEEVKFVIVN